MSEESNIVIKPTPEQIAYTKRILTTWGGNRGFFDGSQTQKEQGILAQIVICDLLVRPRPRDLSQQDQGIDLELDNRSYDVKCRKISGTRDRPEYNNVILDTQLKYSTFGFIFIIWNTDQNDFEIPGWISKEEFRAKATLRKKGEVDNHGLVFPEDTWTLQSRFLRPFSELKTRKIITDDIITGVTK